MKRTKGLEDEPIKTRLILSHEVLKLLINQPHPLEIIALYSFYCYTALWQNMVQVKATDGFCMAGLGMGNTTFYRAKKALAKLGLIKEVQVGRTKSKFGEYYIRVNFNHRWSEIGTPVENNGVHIDSDSPEMEYIYGIPPVSRFPVSRNQDSNTKGSGKNATPKYGNSGDKKKKDIICPIKGWRFGIDYKKFNELCYECKFNDSCEDKFKEKFLPEYL